MQIKRWERGSVEPTRIQRPFIEATTNDSTEISRILHTVKSWNAHYGRQILSFVVVEFISRDDAKIHFTENTDGLAIEECPFRRVPAPDECDFFAARLQLVNGALVIGSLFTPSEKKNCWNVAEHFDTAELRNGRNQCPDDKFYVFVFLSHLGTPFDAFTAFIHQIGASN